MRQRSPWRLVSTIEKEASKARSISQASVCQSVIYLVICRRQETWREKDPFCGLNAQGPPPLGRLGSLLNSVARAKDG